MSADEAAGRLFVYGTLLMPAVLHAVCGRPLASRTATLIDFARYCLRDRVYPAIIAESGASTSGLVCEGLDAGLWQRLDAWESPLYQREVVTIHDAMGNDCHAHTYVLATRHHAEIERRAWSQEEFARLHLPAYLARWTGATP